MSGYADRKRWNYKRYGLRRADMFCYENDKIQTTNLRVGSSNLSGRAIYINYLWDITLFVCVHE